MGAQIAVTDARDPLADARRKLFPPLKNRVLAEAARALADGQLATAESLVTDFLGKKPGDPEALNFLAQIARRGKRFAEAHALMEECIKASPANVGFRYNYAVVLRDAHRPEQALAQLGELLRLDAYNPLFRHQKAALLTSLGRSTEALAIRRDLAREFPLWPEGWLFYAGTLRDAGMQADCVAAYHRALELNPAVRAAYSELAGLKVYRFTTAEIADMEKQLAQSGLPADARANLHHALGKAYGDVKDYAKSFENYAKGNALRRISVKFDPERFAVLTETCKKTFTESFFRERAGWGCASRGPIFIVGLPRSGSTLIEQILSSHSAIEGLGELGDLDSAMLSPLARFRDEVPPREFVNGDKAGLVLAYVRVMDRLTNADFRAAGEDYLRITGARRFAQRLLFTDKTLRNFLCVGLIHLALPNAKIIDARRHPLDCGWSCFKSQFQGSNFSLRLGDIGRDYVNYVRLMAHFDTVLPGRIHRVIYENLVANPEREIRDLLKYLNLPFEEQCLRFHENERAVATQSSEQVRMPLNESGMGQWLPYESWLAPLKSALGEILDRYPNVPR